MLHSMTDNHGSSDAVNWAKSVHQHGFTLIEMMVSMAMGLVIIAGLSMLFVSTGKTTSAITSRTELMGDLFLASHLMQSAIRESVANPTPGGSLPADLQSNGRCKPPSSSGTACWDSVTATCSNTAKSVSLPSNYPSSFPYLPYWHATSNTLTYQDMDGNTGIFQYQRTKNDRIYWLRPDKCSYQFLELIRDLDPANGMAVTSPNNAAGEVLDVVLQSIYSNEQHQSKPLSLSFKIWPRN